MKTNEQLRLELDDDVHLAAVDAINNLKKARVIRSQYDLGYAIIDACMKYNIRGHATQRVREIVTAADLIHGGWKELSA